MLNPTTFLSSTTTAKSLFGWVHFLSLFRCCCRSYNLKFYIQAHKNDSIRGVKCMLTACLYKMDVVWIDNCLEWSQVLYNSFSYCGSKDKENYMWNSNVCTKWSWYCEIYRVVSFSFNSYINLLSWVDFFFMKICCCDFLCFVHETGFLFKKEQLVLVSVFLPCFLRRERLWYSNTCRIVFASTMRIE